MSEKKLQIFQESHIFLKYFLLLTSISLNLSIVINL